MTDILLTIGLPVMTAAIGAAAVTYLRSRRQRRIDWTPVGVISLVTQ